MKFGLPLSLLLLVGVVQAQQLDTKFSCSAPREVEGNQVQLADVGEIHFKGEQIAEFRWESALHRRTHGFDCSIDQGDGLIAERTSTGWRVALKDSKAARKKRGYDFAVPGNCTIRLEQDGDALKIVPSCAALCGSRSNFSALLVDLKTGNCSYTD
jgi:hypothetical protein